MKITVIKMHKPTFVPGVTEFGRTINDQQYRGIQMEAGPLGATCQYKGLTFLLPWVCIECVILGNEASDAKVA